MSHCIKILRVYIYLSLRYGSGAVREWDKTSMRDLCTYYSLTILWQAWVSLIEPHLVELLDEMSLYVPTLCHAIKHLPSYCAQYLVSCVNSKLIWKR